MFVCMKKSDPIGKEITEGLVTADDADVVKDLTFDELENSHVSHISVCTDAHKITGLQLTVKRRTSWMDRAQHAPVQLTRIGSSLNCTDMNLRRGAFFTKIITFGDDRHVAGVAFLDNMGGETHFGSNTHEGSLY